MQCPKCGSESLSVIDSRHTGNEIRRRRECVECKYRFTTYEITETRKARLELALQAYKEMFKNGYE